MNLAPLKTGVLSGDQPRGKLPHGLPGRRPVALSGRRMLYVCLQPAARELGADPASPRVTALPGHWHSVNLPSRKGNAGEKM